RVWRVVLVDNCTESDWRPPVSHLLGFTLLLGPLASDVSDLKKLDQLLAWHIYYGLPLPPQDAVLMQFITEPSLTLRDGGWSRYVDSGSRLLAFALDDSFPWKIRSIKCVKPTALLVRNGVTANWLEIALIAHERGWKPLAVAAFRRWKD